MTQPNTQSTLRNRYRGLWRLGPVWYGSAWVLGLLLYVPLQRYLSFEDFGVFHQAAARYLAGEPLYRLGDGHLSFKYFPTTALLLAPLGALPLAWASALWLGCLVAGLLAIYRTSLRWTGASAWPIGALACVVLLKATGRELMLGQVNLLMGLGLVAAFRTQHRPAYAALWATLAIALKPYAVAIWPYWVVRRQWQALALSATGVVALGLLSLLRYPVAEWPALYEGFTATTFGSNARLFTALDNVSLWGAYSRWFGAAPLGAPLALWVGLSLVVLAAPLVPRWWRGAYTPVRLQLEGSALLVLLVLATPQGWDYTICLAVPAVVLLLHRRNALPTGLRVLVYLSLALTGLTLYDLVVPLVGRAGFEALRASGLYTLALAVWVLALGWLHHSKYDASPSAQ
ncbi:MAG: glycosyltransferase family 87 protein [Bacteroidia bacterium]|nr:glycosyltransferase family 87 protein [Bacteroidia bacterium]